MNKKLAGSGGLHNEQTDVGDNGRPGLSIIDALAKLNPEDSERARVITEVLGNIAASVEIN